MEYCRHYITADARGLITDGWSDGPHPEWDTSGAVCIRAEGGYQFRLRPGGRENPPLYTVDGIPLYRWDGQQAVSRSEEEIAADREALPAPPPPPPGPAERLDALEAAIEKGLSL